VVNRHILAALTLAVAWAPSAQAACDWTGSRTDWWHCVQDTFDVVLEDIATLFDDVDSAQTDIEALDGRADGLELDVASHDGRLGDAEADIASVAVTADDHTVSISDQQDRLAFLEEPGRVVEPGSLNFRGSFTVWNESFDITSNSYETIPGFTGLDLAGAVNSFSSAPGTVARWIRFRTIHSDNLTGAACSPYNSEWRLAAHNDIDQVQAEWTLGGTWSGGSLFHLRASPYIDWSTVDAAACDAGWAGGSCRFYIRIRPECGPHTLSVRSIALEIYDEAG
jgi:hypothetical protein